MDALISYKNRDGKKSYSSLLYALRKRWKAIQAVRRQRPQCGFQHTSGWNVSRKAAGTLQKKTDLGVRMLVAFHSSAPCTGKQNSFLSFATHARACVTVSDCLFCYCFCRSAGILCFELSIYHLLSHMLCGGKFSYGLQLWNAAVFAHVPPVYHVYL